VFLVKRARGGTEQGGAGEGGALSAHPKRRTDLKSLPVSQVPADSRGGVERATGWATGLATREVTLSAMSPEMLVEMRSTGEGEVRQVASAQRTSG
jgi:hypothetical protein